MCGSYAKKYKVSSKKFNNNKRKNKGEVPPARCVFSEVVKGWGQRTRQLVGDVVASALDGVHVLRFLGNCDGGLGEEVGKNAVI